LTKLGEIEVLRLLPKHVFQLVRCGRKGLPRRRTGDGPSDPLVGDLRWRARIRGPTSFASWHATTARGPGREPSTMSLWDPRSSRGSTRAIQFCVGAASRRSGSSA